jgi:hypothetical protein
MGSKDMGYAILRDDLANGICKPAFSDERGSEYLPVSKWSRRVLKATRAEKRNLLTGLQRPG